MLKRLLNSFIKEPADRERAGIIWNIIGSTVYALTGILLGFLVMRMLGADAGGIFLFAFSTLGQHIFIVAYFGMRPAQVTDTEYRYSYGEYRMMRILTCAAAVLFGLVFALIYAGDDPLKKTVIIYMVIYRTLDGWADLSESEMQREGRLYLTGRCLTARMLFSVICFVIAMAVTKSLPVSCSVLCAAMAAGAVLNEMTVRKLPMLDTRVIRTSVRELFKSGSFIFAATFLDLYIFAASKYAVDAMLPASISGLYATLFIPTMAITLASGYIIRPALTELSGYRDSHNRKGFVSLTVKITAVIAGLTVIAVILGYTIGTQVLSLLVDAATGAEIVNYKTEFALIMGGGGIYALIYLLYYVLIILRKQKEVFVIYAVGTAAAWILSYRMVGAMGVRGGALSYLICVLAEAAAFAAVTVKTVRDFGWKPAVRLRSFRSP